MFYRVAVQSGEHRFAAAPDESILDAALRQGLTLPYGCRNGVCGACKTQVISGSVDHDGAEEQALNADERARGFALLCCARARSDLELACREIAPTANPALTLPARVESIDRLAPDVIRLRLKLPASERLQFTPGQYVEILLKDGRRRSFSIANAPHDDALLELHLRLIPGGAFTEYAFSTLKLRDMLRLHGPLGSFHLDQSSTRPILCIAGGTGFAPLKSMIEHAFHIGCERPITLYWGSRDTPGLYAAELVRQWQVAHANFSFVPVLSDPPPSDSWNGRRGLVHRAAIADIDNLAAHDVYVCGAPAMIDTARHDFVSDCGLPAERFFADAFTYTRDA